MFYCFGCHAGGTAIQFIMQMERLSFVEAVKLLAARAGMELPDDAGDAALQRERAYKERLYAACRKAARFYMETLLGPDGAPGRAYLAGRGLTSEAVKRFGIGFAPASWERAEKPAHGGGLFTQQELLDAGLLVHNTEKNSVYDAYRNRVIFPIIGTSGRVLGFGARVLGDEKPKYINTGDTPIYNKRNNLYGLYLQKGRGSGELVMVEGYMDVIGLFEAGGDQRRRQPRHGADGAAGAACSSASSRWCTSPTTATRPGSRRRCAGWTSSRARGWTCA